MKKEKIKQKTLDLMDKQSVYVEGCIDKIYEYFHKYGYIWFDTEELPPTRERIEDTIINNLDSAIKYGQASGGRIHVDYDKEMDIFEVHIVL